MNNIQRNNQRGFTIVEIIIALTVIGIIIPTITSILFTLFQQQRLLMQLSQIKREGDNITKYVRDTVKKNSYQIVEEDGTQHCQQATTVQSYENSDGNFYFKLQNNQEFRIYVEGENLEYEDMTTGISTAIHSANAKIENFVIGCYTRSQYSSPLLYVKFTISPKASVAGVPSKSLSYQTILKLSTY